MKMPSAVLMAGGRGTRLLPYTRTIPKPLLSLGEDTILARLLRQMREHGVEDVTIALGHYGEQIRTAVGDGGAFGLRVRYVHEDEPLGTCGVVSRLLDSLDETFILANGDLLTDLDFRALVARHRETQADATVGVFGLETCIPFGVLSVDAQQNVCGYDEKPKSAYDVSMGIYVLQREAVRSFFTPPDQARDMPQLINWLIARSGKIVACRGASFWIDVGTPSDYIRAADMLAARTATRETESGELL